MKEQGLASSGDTGSLHANLIASSKNRAWSGLAAALHRKSGGHFEVRPCFLHYTLRMNVGTPVGTVCRYDDGAHQGLHTPGDIDIIPLGILTEWEEDGPSTSLKVHLMATLLESTADHMGLSANDFSIEPQFQIRDPKLQYICWAFKAELENGDPRERLYAESLGAAIATHLLHRYSRAPLKVPNNGLTRRQLSATIEFINSHLGSDLSLAEIAAAAGMSPSYFKTLFKRSTGLPVHQYVMRQRVEYAVRLISAGQMQLVAVAQQAGFADQSHMARCMRRIIGLTPMDIVRNAR